MYVFIHIQMFQFPRYSLMHTMNETCVKIFLPLLSVLERNPRCWTLVFLIFDTEYFFIGTFINMYATILIIL